MPIRTSDTESHWRGLSVLLVFVSIAVKRHHDHGNSYKEHLTVVAAYIQRSSPLSSRWGAWWPAGRHDAGYTLIRRQQEAVTLSEAWAKETSESTPTVTHFLQQATPPDSATPYEFNGVSCIQIITLIQLLTDPTSALAAASLTTSFAVGVHGTAQQLQKRRDYEH